MVTTCAPLKGGKDQTSSIVRLSSSRISIRKQTFTLHNASHHPPGHLLLSPFQDRRPSLLQQCRVKLFGNDHARHARTAGIAFHGQAGHWSPGGSCSPASAHWIGSLQLPLGPPPTIAPVKSTGPFSHCQQSRNTPRPRQKQKKDDSQPTPVPENQPGPFSAHRFPPESAETASAPAPSEFPVPRPPFSSSTPLLLAPFLAKAKHPARQALAYATSMS
ncbi:hypothetical protein V8F06_001475 [Rhypophila decipiens]